MSAKTEAFDKFIRDTYGFPAAEAPARRGKSVTAEIRAAFKAGIRVRATHTSCIWEDCDLDAIYCEGHAREFADPLGRVKHFDELHEALKRAEHKLTAYIGVCDGDKELTDTVVPMARAALAKVDAS